VSEPGKFTVETVHLDLPPTVGAFSRRLHEAGVPITPARSADLARALTLTRPVSRRRLYWTARAVLVSDDTQVATFDAVFAAVFGGRAPDRAPELDDAPAVPAAHDDRAGRDRDPPGESWRRGAGTGAASPARDARGEDEDRPEAEVPLAMASDEEVLRSKSFDALEAHELAALYRMMADLGLATPTRRTRRFLRRRRGEQIDLRRTLRASLHTAGDPVRLAHRRRRIVARRLVMLCDISGSMEPYARAYLQFLASAAGSGPDAEAFVFATRLTRVTRALRSRNPQRAIQRAAAAAPDWSSGTRIGDALREFNDRHGRRGMARGAVIVILSDGWERGDPALVGREMQRLARLAHRIVWVNPRVGADAFAVQAGGMVAALPHLDALVSGHSFEALREVTAAIAADQSDLEAPARRWAVPPAGASDEPESWPSATPVAGSSVAMPSGYGPKRGHTTPGWSSDEHEKS
jgi:uncharacterized protein